MCTKINALAVSAVSAQLGTPKRFLNRILYMTRVRIQNDGRFFFYTLAVTWYESMTCSVENIVYTFFFILFFFFFSKTRFPL